MKIFLTHTFSPMMTQIGSTSTIQEVSFNDFVIDLIDVGKDDSKEVVSSLDRVFLENVKMILPGIELFPKIQEKVKAEPGDLVFAVISKDYKVHLRKLTESEVKNIKFRFFQVEIF